MRAKRFGHKNVEKLTEIRSGKTKKLNLVQYEIKRSEKETRRYKLGNMNKLSAFITLFILASTSNVNSQLDDVAGGFLSGTLDTKKNKSKHFSPIYCYH